MPLVSVSFISDVYFILYHSLYILRVLTLHGFFLSVTKT